ncbi:hypothetical protein [Microbacterium sp. JZ31]|uniref:hypothetical protein n=1 Tax=Microbacterium sp. JZ31 TaxID=1906274 RepID=UPI001931C664|nr:hypothetical protein [Microbacterium sp. JZ31]
MSAPHQPSVPQPPAPGGYAAPYVAPQDPRFAQALQAPAARPSAALGTVALILSLVAAIGASVVLAVALAAIGAGVGPRLQTIVPGTGLEILTPVRDMVLVAEIAVWVAGALGIWALIQGIVAVVKRRGRGAGIAAIVISAVGPFLAGIAAFVGAVLGIAGSGAV